MRDNGDNKDKIPSAAIVLVICSIFLLRSGSQNRIKNITKWTRISLFSADRVLLFYSFHSIVVTSVPSLNWKTIRSSA